MTSTQTMDQTSTDKAPLLRPHAEQRYAEELAALARLDERTRPASWRLCALLRPSHLRTHHALFLPDRPSTTRPSATEELP